MLMKSKKPGQTNRVAIMALIKDNPGITSPEIAKRVGLPNATRVTSVLWKDVRSERVLVERVCKDGYWVNAHYLPDQVPPDAVERIRQKLISSEDVIPAIKSPGVQNSVFDVPGSGKPAKKSHRKTAARHVSSPTPVTPAPARVVSHGFACAVTNDGSLVLMRAGEIQFSLNDVEAATLQSYLVKRAAASMFASMT